MTQDAGAANGGNAAKPVERPAAPVPGGKVGAVVVVGGGVAGIQAALDIAESGFHVYIVEKTPSIGGVMAQLDKTFPTNDCAMCILAPKLVETGRHPDIEIIAGAEVEKVEGGEGNFRVTVRKRVASIDPRKCTACGRCTEICPIETTSSFDEGLCERLSWSRRGLEAPAPNQVAELRQARERNALVPLPREGELSRLDYLRSWAAVVFLERRVGRDRLLAVVRATLAGEPFDRALARELSLTPDEVDRDFAAWVGTL